MHVPSPCSSRVLSGGRSVCHASFACLLLNGMVAVYVDARPRARTHTHTHTQNYPMSTFLATSCGNTEPEQTE